MKLPIRSKLEMIQDVSEILLALHDGDRDLLERLVIDLKGHALCFDDMVQRDVLQFSENVQFQLLVDPNRLITADIEKAADRLVEDLGFYLHHD